MHPRNLRLKILEYVHGWRMAAAIAALMFAGYATPAHALPSCLSTISSCGCSIDSAAVFETSGALVSADPSTDCIDIAASGAVLVLKGNITGPGGGVTADGIHIMSGALGVFISGRTVPLFGAHASIGGFATGIQVDGSNAEIDRLDATGNVTNGVVFNNVTNSDYDDSDAKSNAGGDGVLVKGGSGDIVADCSHVDMNNNGIEISGSSNNRIADSGAASNKVYGIWFAKSSGNHINGSSTDKNVTGTYIGCSASGGPTGKNCKKTKGKAAASSKSNRMLNSGGNMNSDAGVALDLGDSFNVIDGSGGSSNTAGDAVDKNNKCDHNVWMENGFGTASQSCIH